MVSLEDTRSYWLLRAASGLPRTSWSALAGGGRDHSRSEREVLRSSAPAGLSAQLDALTRGAPVLRVVAAPAAAALVLHRASGATRVTLGTPRRAGEGDGDPGAVLLLLDLEPESSFRDALLATRQVCLEAYAHQGLPLSALQAELPEPELPPTHIALAMDGVHGALEALAPELSVRWAADLSAEARYDPSRLEAGAVERFLRLVYRALEAALTSPGTPWGRLELASAEDRAAVLQLGAPVRAPQPATAPLHGRVFAVAERAPTSVALVLGEETLTYGALAARAKGLASHLLAAGLTAGERVAVFADRRLELPIAQLGVMAAGGVYAPIDPALPPARQAQLLGVCGARLAIGAPPELEAELAAPSWPLEALGAGTEVEATLPRVSAGSPAYAIFTSGSTGGPRAALIAHRGVVELLDETGALFEIGHETRVLQFATSAFDASLWQLYMGLAHGARVIMVPSEVFRSPEHVAALIREAHVEVADVAPVILSMLDPAEVPSLRVVSTGGERCSPEVRRRWAAATRFFNVYGPTEASIATTFMRVLPEAAEDVGVIGRPFAHAGVYVVDEELAPVPVGIIGELVITGAGVGLGYLGQPELTAQRFTRDPFGPPGGRLYKSGDLARWRDDGTLELLGRADDQVKLRGFRIELGEIEAVLGALPGVAEAVVSVQRDMLVAHLTARPGEVPPAEAAMREAVRRALPAYMVPARCVVVASVPRLASQRVDRARLPAVSASEGPAVPPRTEDERAIAEAWRAVLGVEAPSVHDNFFQLGGHSLLVTQVAARLAASAGVDLPLMAFFEHPTIAGLAGAMEAARLAAADPELLARLIEEAEARAPAE